MQLWELALVFYGVSKFYHTGGIRRGNGDKVPDGARRIA